MIIAILAGVLGIASSTAQAITLQPCARALESWHTGVIRINPDGTEEREPSRKPTPEEIERERIDQDERDDYYRRRQPQIIPVEDVPTRTPDPVPGVSFPIPSRPVPSKKDLPN